MVLGMTRIFNSFVEAMNTRKKLPKYVILVPDINFVQHIKVEHILSDPVPLITNCLEWMLCNLENYLSHHKIELFEKRPGALIAGTPKIIWVKLLKRPDDIRRRNKLYALRSKFNNTLELLLVNQQSHFEHLILSIDVGEDNGYDQFGSLSSTGKDKFWNELNSCIQRYEIHQINLKPKSKNKKSHRSSISAFNHGDGDRDQTRSSRRSHSRSRSSHRSTTSHRHIRHHSKHR